VRWFHTGLLIGEVVPFTLIIIMPTNHKLLAISSDATSSETRDLLIRGVTPDGVERTNNEQRSRSASWAAPWFSSFGSDFKYDFGVATDEGETFGLSVSSATATTSITPTSPRDAASNSWSATSAISIWRRMVARRCGKTHSRVGRKPHSMNGSVTTIDTELLRRRLCSGSTARDGLEHTHPVALCVDERHILSHAGYLDRLAEHFSARICYLPY
jgi:hypothetical protein